MDMLINMADTQPGNTENIEEGALTKRSYMARVGALAKAEGMGDNSRPGLFIVTCEAACKRVIKPEDAEDIFDKYSKGVAATQGVGWKAQSSAKQQVSKLRTAIRLGELNHVNGLEVCNKVVAAQKAQRIANEGKNDYSPFDGLVKVARAQLKTPDAILPDDVIAGYLIKGTGELPEEADRLEKIVKSIESLIGAKEDPVSEESADALTEAAGSLMTRIKELGGSASMRKQADKAQREADKARGEHAALVDRAHAARARLSIVSVANTAGTEIGTESEARA